MLILRVSAYTAAVDVVCIIFRANGPRFCAIAITIAILLIVSTLAVAVRCGDAKAVELICHGVTYAIAILRVNAVVVLIFTLILDTERETVHQTKEVRVTVGQQTASTAGHVVISIGAAPVSPEK